MPSSGQFSLGEDVSGVVDEYVEAVVAGLEVLGDVVDLLLRLEVGEDQVGDASAVRRTCDLIAGGGAAVGVSAQQTTRSAPAAASTCAVARPMPLLAPVMRTVLPCIGDVVDDMVVS
jgi:hypothetical protein